MSAPVNDLTHRGGRQDSHDASKGDNKENDWTESTQTAAVGNGASVLDDPLPAKYVFRSGRSLAPAILRTRH